jgi:hypothetical protein
MTNEGILEIAMRQSAIDANCQASGALTSGLALEVLNRGKFRFTVRPGLISGRSEMP